MPRYEALTVDLAIEQGLADLNLPKNQVEIKVLTAGKRGFLGFGRRNAVILIKPNKEFSITEVLLDPVLVESSIEEEEVRDITLEKVAAYIQPIIETFDEAAVLQIVRQKKCLKIHIRSDKAGLLIGKHGQVINALQYLTQVYAQQIDKNYIEVIVDVENYRKRRYESLRRLADQTAKEVLATKLPVYLEPMTAADRKVIHGMLKRHRQVQTHSEGKEPYRYLVVSLE